MDLLIRLTQPIWPIVCTVMMLGGVAINKIQACSRLSGSDQASQRSKIGDRMLLLGLLLMLIWLSSAALFDPKWLGRAVWFFPLLILGSFILVAVLVLIRTRDTLRTVRFLNRGDIAGAIAALEARVPCRLVPGTELAFEQDPEITNLWAAPSSTLSGSAQPETRLATRLNLLGLLESKREGWARALAWYERAEAADGANREIPANRAVALSKLGRPEAGLVILRAVLARDPVAGPLLQCRLTLQLASVLIAADHLAEARVALDNAEVDARRISPLFSRARKQFRGMAETLQARLAAAGLDAVADHG